MVIYTVIYNDYDTLKDPRFIDKDVRYVCFTNTPKETDVWEIVELPMKSVKDQRRIKIIGYQDFEDDWSIYIDASIEIKASAYNFAYQWEEDLTMLQHRGRDCIYQEAEAVLNMKKDDRNVVWEQMKKYLGEDFPRHQGMIQTGMMFRRRNLLVDNFCDAWWDEVRQHSKRDQLSFNYVAHKLKKEYDIVPVSTFEQCFRLHAHREIQISK